MEGECCENCKFFRRYYIKCERGYVAVNSGHCHHARKILCLDDICGNFVKKDLEEIKIEKEKLKKLVLEDINKKLAKLLEFLE